MSGLTETLKNMVEILERDHGLKREAIHDGKYRTRRDRRRCVSDPSPEMVAAIAKYEVLVMFLDRFGKTEKESRDRKFIDDMMAIADLHDSSIRNLLDLIMESNLKISRALRKREITGQEEMLSREVEHSCVVMAALSLKIRDIEKGIRQDRDGVITMTGSN